MPYLKPDVHECDVLRRTIMKNEKRKLSYSYLDRHLLSVGLVLVALFWVVESLVDTYLFHEEDVASSLLPLDEWHQITDRLAIAIGLMALVGYCQYVVNKRRRAEAEVLKLNGELEQRVRQRTVDLQKSNDDLKASNRELTSFSHSVAHDLRAPLRAINGFGTLLMQEHGDDLDEQGKDYLERIVSSSLRMGHLIDDLLNLTQITRTRMRRER